jgi:hypothetical protein
MLETGIFAGPGSAGVEFLPVYAKWLGSPAMRVTENFNQESWDEMLSGAAWSCACYAMVRHQVNFTFSVPMLPAQGGATLSQGASGAYDDKFYHMAHSLVMNGHDTATIRIGWEFNGDWQPWRADLDPDAWVAFYRRIVGIMRKASPRFLFDWCPNVDTHCIDPERVYPGDDVVDYIGMDLYTGHWNDGDDWPLPRWNGYLTRPNGLQWHVDFAQRKMKRLSMPEWGCCGQNTGDDPTSINLMADWLRANSYMYAVYWEQTAAYNAKLSDNNWPEAAKAYIANFR